MDQFFVQLARCDWWKTKGILVVDLSGMIVNHSQVTTSVSYDKSYIIVRAILNKLLSFWYNHQNNRSFYWHGYWHNFYHNLLNQQIMRDLTINPRSLTTFVFQQDTSISCTKNCGCKNNILLIIHEYKADTETSTKPKIRGCQQWGRETFFFF